MNSNIIMTGTPVEFELFYHDGSRIGTTYKGEFTEVISGMEVVIAVIGQELAYVNIANNIHIMAYFHHQLHGLLQFEGTIYRKKRTRIGINFYIKIDDSFEQIQKREYFRPICLSPAEFRLLNEPDLPLITAQTRNISFKGICLLINKNSSAHDFKLDSLIEVTIKLKDSSLIQTTSKIVRISKYQVNKVSQIELGLTIENISERDAEILADFITKSSYVGSLYLGESPLTT